MDMHLNELYAVLDQLEAGRLPEARPLAAFIEACAPDLFAADHIAKPRSFGDGRKLALVHHTVDLYADSVDESFLLGFLLLSFLESITRRVFTSFNTCFVLGEVHILYLLQLQFRKDLG